MGNTQETNCFASRVHQRKVNSDIIHKTNKQRNDHTLKKKIISQKSESSRFSRQFSNRQAKQPSESTNNSKTITIEIKINLNKNQQFNPDDIEGNGPLVIEIGKALTSSLNISNKKSKQDSSFSKGYSTSSNTFNVTSKKKIQSQIIYKSEKEKEFDELSLPSQSNLSDQ